MASLASPASSASAGGTATTGGAAAASFGSSLSAEQVAAAAAAATSTSTASSTLDLSLNKSRALPDVNLSAFAFLFAELVKHSYTRVTKIADLESKLARAGKAVGYRVLELETFRQRRGRRDKKIIPMLQFVTGPCWKSLFGKEADALQASADEDGVYMIYEAKPCTNKYISVPANLGGNRALNVAAYIGGIIAGILTGAGFAAAVQTLLAEDGRTAFVVTFEAEVVARDKLVN
jgi:hypothetical protein